MKITLINGSPKLKGSASGILLNELKSLRSDDCMTEYGFHTPVLPPEWNLQKFAQQDAAVFAFPLYVDGVPSHLVNCLCQLENYLKTHPSNLIIYAIVNCGFFEGNQNRYALEIMKNWCAKSGLKWGQGIGIGGGGMLDGLQNVPAGKGPRKNFSDAIRQLSEHITVGTSAENIYVSPGIPRFTYKIGGEIGWRQQIKANGLSEKELSRKL
jgi:multimeric flavodoxin WrbA